MPVNMNTHSMEVKQKVAASTMNEWYTGNDDDSDDGSSSSNNNDNLHSGASKTVAALCLGWCLCG